MGLMEKRLILNRWQTPDGTVLTSYHTHDYVEHTDKNGEYYFIDGGNDYVRMSANNEPMKNLCVYSDSPFSEIRSTLCRGTFDKDKKRIWIPLCNMSNPHLENCITYYARLFSEEGCTNRYMVYYMIELLLRWYSNEYIQEKVYTQSDTEPRKEKSELVREFKHYTLETGIVDTLVEFSEKIDAGNHTDEEDVIMLVQHILDLWCEKDENTKEIVKKIFG